MTPADDDVLFAGAARQAALIREKRVSPVELVTGYLERIDIFDVRLRAFITVCRESALAEAFPSRRGKMKTSTSPSISRSTPA